MTTINGKACVANGRNLYLNSKAIEDAYARNTTAVNITVEPFDSTTNMWHFVAEQGVGSVGIYLSDYANGKIPDNSYWSYSADVKGIGNVRSFGIEAGDHNPVVGTVGSEWSRVSQTGHVGEPTSKTLSMYFDTTSNPLDVYIKLPKLEIGSVATPLAPAPVDKVFSNGRQVYGRNLALDTSNPISAQGISNAWQNVKILHLSQNPAGLTVTFSYAVTIDRSDSGSLRMQFDSNFSPAWGMPISVDFKNLQPGVKTKFNRTIVFPTFIGSGNFNDSMIIGIVSSAALVKFEDLKVEIGNVATPWSPAPEDVM